MTKLIFACDVSELELGLAIIDKTAPHIDVVKTGLEAMTAIDDFGETLARGFAIRADERKKKVMWDMKLHDVANTMRNATKNILQIDGLEFFTIHAGASDEALAAVAEEAGEKAMPLAVTVLTDLDDQQCQTIFGNLPASVVARFAKRARHFGIKGFVCSAQEAQIVRQAVPDAYIVTPGIRPLWSVSKDEQKRIMTPTQAKQAGADAIVVGRPIYKPPLNHTEASAAREIKQELEAA
jgi:orotidine-5'-phosphate decarboxylase